ncbi:carbohydrate ABC transporter permease [Anaerobium acetethylicum]|uniref:Raffinose/stachyose/melibiose transport system permease protein n=1 Tax=Anaerobium acetethylicum TaxID=1619234 RepID=A0A1D3TY40_9FIRM|nr:carbohydrate ABC transporter permease [Anaerobium acetethylicum]SCP99315.1 raffinose/stachyose/melibiose transport system permease protein [Anaerobium acetethylicum]
MKKNIQNILKQLVCIVLCLAVVVPFYMVLINSFKSKSEAARMSLALPKEWLFSNYVEVIEKGKLIQGFSNSLSYALTATIVAVISCAMASFVICRKPTKLNVFIYYFVLCGLFFPVNYVTLVKVLNFFHLTDNKPGIIIAFTSAMIPFCIFTIRNFILSVPIELDEAAVIDGAGPIELFFRIIVPLLKPTLVTCFILQFMGVWSDFLTPLYLSSSSKLFPMTMAVYQFFGKNKSYWNYIFADIILTCIPVIIVYMLGQKYIVGGMTSGAVKE